MTRRENVNVFLGFSHIEMLQFKKRLRLFIFSSFVSEDAEFFSNKINLDFLDIFLRRFG